MWSLCFPMQASSMSNPLSCLFSLSGWSSAALLFACLSLPFCWCQLSHSYVGFLLLFTRSSCISLVFLLFIAKKACAYKQWGTWENHWLSASGEAASWEKEWDLIFFFLRGKKSETLLYIHDCFVVSSLHTYKCFEISFSFFTLD